MKIVQSKYDYVNGKFVITPNTEYELEIKCQYCGNERCEQRYFNSMELLVVNLCTDCWKEFLNNNLQ